LPRDFLQLSERMWQPFLTVIRRRRGSLNDAEATTKGGVRRMTRLRIGFILPDLRHSHSYMPTVMRALRGCRSGRRGHSSCGAPGRACQAEVKTFTLTPELRENARRWGGVRHRPLGWGHHRKRREVIRRGPGAVSPVSKASPVRRRSWRSISLRPPSVESFARRPECSSPQGLIHRPAFVEANKSARSV
jgi:hypothetical protein